MDFCDVLSNPVYNTATTIYEKAEMYLNLMWQPTAADTAIMDYAIGKCLTRYSFLSVTDYFMFSSVMKEHCHLIIKKTCFCGL
ncbi:unnamed protein product [Dibothriocephalus latus]|uniref:Uncharacterized protein n=1 Tax=Dibothriocephalus latus TaxID=60516 RepID=A0A3P7PBN8_DIBLA|nr:unnamed protein product [Dibothriocephalus latus]